MHWKNLSRIGFIVAILAAWTIMAGLQAAQPNWGAPVTFNKTFGGAYSDYGQSVKQTTDGGYIVAGATQLTGSTNPTDLWLIKTDDLGNPQWEKTWASLYGAWANSVVQTSDGGYIVAGWKNTSGAHKDDVWIIKTDASGNQQWDKTFDGGYEDMAKSVMQTADGGYIIAGGTSYYGGGNSDVWLIKTDASGNQQWNKVFGGSYLDYANSVQQTADGGYILTGNIDNYGAGGNDVWLIKTDASGNQQWDIFFGGGNTDTGYSVQQTTDGGYIVAGVTQSYGAGGSDVWLIKTDASGNQQWNKTLGGTSDDEALSIQQTKDGGYIVTGWTGSLITGISGVWLIKTDASGNIQWDKVFDGPNYEAGSSVRQTTDGGYIIAGRTTSFGAGYSDAWLIKTDASGNAPPVP